MSNNLKYCSRCNLPIHGTVFKNWIGNYLCSKHNEQEREEIKERAQSSEHWSERDFAKPIGTQLEEYEEFGKTEPITLFF